jgi:transcriptional regulator with XRE-family HTH domain
MQVATARKEPRLMDRHVGSRVRMRRMMLGLSQEKLGEDCGITFQQIQKYEKGVNRIGASRLAQIAELLQVPVSFFFEGAETHPRLDKADAEAASEVDRFVTSADGIRLTRAFARITSAETRRSLVELAERIAERA